MGQSQCHIQSDIFPFVCRKICLISLRSYVFFDGVGNVRFIIPGNLFYVSDFGDQVLLVFGEIVTLRYHPRYLLRGNGQGFNGIRLGDVDDVQHRMLENPRKKKDADQCEADFGMLFPVEAGKDEKGDVIAEAELR